MYDSLQDKEIWTHQPSAGNNKVPANLKWEGVGGWRVEGHKELKDIAHKHTLLRFAVVKMSQGSQILMQMCATMGLIFKGSILIKL